MSEQENVVVNTKMYAWIAGLVTLADQLSKWAAVAGLTHAFDGTGAGGPELSFGDKLGRFMWARHPVRDQAVTVLDDFWHFRYVENPGAAWGFLSGSASALRTPFFLAVSLFAMVFIVLYFRRTLPEQHWTRFGLALVFGGAIGNFLDRVRLGYVIDFIEWHWYDKATWPTFNVADAAISIGVGILMLEMFLQKPPEAAPAAKTARGRAG